MNGQVHQAKEKGVTAATPLVQSPKKLSPRRSVYPHRALSVFASMGALQETFGMDEFMYNVWLLVIPQMLLLSYAGIVMIQVLVALVDYGGGHDGENWQPLVADMLTNPYRAVAYFLVIINMTVFVRTTTLYREAERRRRDMRAGIQDYSLLIQRVPASEPLRELKPFLEGLAGGTVVSVCRVVSPSILPLRQRIIAAQELTLYYYDRLLAAGGAPGPRQQKRLQRRIERLGRRIEQVQKAVLAEKQKNGMLDALIVTFSTPRERHKCLRQLTRWCGRPRYRGVHRLAARRIAGPEETLYENLNVSGWRRCGHMCLSFVVVLALSVLAFIVIISLKAVNYDTEAQVQNYIESQVVYYSIFLIVQLFDLAFRPILASFQRRERHYMLSNAERSWMVKLYVYKVLNRLTVYYWQNFLKVIKGEHRTDPTYNFFRIYDYKTVWRFDRNHQGYDAMFFTLLNVFLGNVLDLAEYTFYLVWSKCTAKTERDKAAALELRPVRYANKYVNMLTYLTIVLMFAHLYPLLLVYACPYFLLQQLVVRVLQFRLAAKTPRTTSLSQQFEVMAHVMGYLQCLFLSQSYINQYAYYYIGLAVAYATWSILLHNRRFTSLVAKYYPSVRVLVGLSAKGVELSKIDRSEAIHDLGRFEAHYQVGDKAAEIDRNDSLINKRRQEYLGCARPTAHSSRADEGMNRRMTTLKQQGVALLPADVQ